MLLWVLAAAASPAVAEPRQGPSEFRLGDELGEGTLDLAVPESPAFSALGLTPQQVSRPSTARELATSFLNGVDRDGNFQTGIAIDVAPYMLLAGPRITLQQYQRSDQYLTRFLARWQMSFATSRGGGAEDTSSKLALGMRFTLLDEGDPRTDDRLLSCLSDAADAVLASADPLPPTMSDDQIALEMRRREESVRAAARPCRQEAEKRRWNRSAWIVGVAPTWTSPDGTTSRVEYSGTALWTSAGFGFEGVPVLEDHAMLAAYVKMRNQEVAPDPLDPGSFVTQDSLTAGARFLFGQPSTQFNVEALWIRNDREDSLEDRYWNLGFGFEQRLVENIWLNLAFGRQLAREESGNDFTVVGGFNWGFGPR